MLHADSFLKDFQEIKNNPEITHKAATLRAMERNINSIDKENSQGSTIVFSDGSAVRWTGKQWRAYENREEAVHMGGS